MNRRSFFKSTFGSLAGVLLSLFTPKKIINAEGSKKTKTLYTIVQGPEGQGDYKWKVWVNTEMEDEDG